jgi:hypothetical protein
MNSARFAIEFRNFGGSVENPSNSARPVTKAIQLLSPDGRLRQFQVPCDSHRLMMPILIPGEPGFGSVEYRDSGERMADGAELWASDWKVH